MDSFEPLEGCGFCGPFCPRCTSARPAPVKNRQNRHDFRRQIKPVLHSHDLVNAVFQIKSMVSKTGDISLERWWSTKTRRQYTRTVGEEWALMCRRVLGVVGDDDAGFGCRAGRRGEIVRALVLHRAWEPVDFEDAMVYEARINAIIFSFERDFRCLNRHKSKFRHV